MVTEVGTAVLPPWIPEDNLLLKNAVEAGASLESLAKGAVRFSRRYSIAELRDRWRSLLYDPDVSAEASASMANLELSGKAAAAAESEGPAAATKKRKRKGPSLRKQYYAMRKKVCDQVLDELDMALQDEMNCDKDSYNEFQRIECLKNNLSSNNLVDYGSYSGLGDVGHSHSTSDVPLWKTIEDVPAPTMPVQMIPENKDNVLKGNCPIDVLNASAAMLSGGGDVRLSDSLFNSGNEDELLFTEDKPCYEAVDSLLLSSPCQIQGSGPSVICESQKLAIETKAAVICSSSATRLLEDECMFCMLNTEDPDVPSFEMTDLSILLPIVWAMKPQPIDEGDGYSDSSINNRSEKEAEESLKKKDKNPSQSYTSSQPQIVPNIKSSHPPVGVVVKAEYPVMNPISAVSRQNNNPVSAVARQNNNPISAIARESNNSVSAVTRESNNPISAVTRQSNNPIISAIARESNNPISAVARQITNPIMSAVSRESNNPISAVARQGNNVNFNPSHSRIVHATITPATDVHLKQEVIDRPASAIVYAHPRAEEHANLPESEVKSLSLNQEGGDNDYDDSDDDYGNEVPSFSEAEAMILDMEFCPSDQDTNASREVLRYQHAETKKTIMRLEQCAHSFMQRAIASHGAFAVLYGRNLKQYINKSQVILGRGTDDIQVDIDLRREGRANKISRRQALIKMATNGSFLIKNLGKNSIFLNGNEVARGQMRCLNTSNLIEVRGLSFIFETNNKSVKRYLENLDNKGNDKKKAFTMVTGEGISKKRNDIEGIAVLKV